MNKDKKRQIKTGKNRQRLIMHLSLQLFKLVITIIIIIDYCLLLCDSGDGGDDGGDDVQ